MDHEAIAREHIEKSELFDRDGLAAASLDEKPLHVALYVVELNVRHDPQIGAGRVDFADVFRDRG